MKKYLSVILSLILVFGVIFTIAGCNKDNNNDTPTESTDAIDETESTTEEASADTTESTTKGNESDSTSEADENETASSDKPIETTTQNDEPVTCDNCGGILIGDSGAGDVSIGNYCDGKCDEWLSF